MSARDQAKDRQDYDPDPPRCFLCVYFKRELAKKYGERIINGRPTRVRLNATPYNKTVTRCTFGNFEVSPAGICNEWRGRNGETLEDGS